MNIISLVLMMIVLIVGVVLIVGLVNSFRRKPPKMNDEPAKRSDLFPGLVDDPSEALISNTRLEHVEDLIKRDFPAEKHTEVVEALAKYTKAYKATVYHMILQEAEGNIDKVKEYVEIANNQVGDFRDLAQALMSLKSK